MLISLRDPVFKFLYLFLNIFLTTFIAWSCFPLHIITLGRSMSRLPLPSLSFHARSAPASIRPPCSIFFHTNMIYLFFLSFGFRVFNFQVAGFLCVIHSANDGPAGSLSMLFYRLGRPHSTWIPALFFPCYIPSFFFVNYSASDVQGILLHNLYIIYTSGSFGDFVLLSFRYGCCDIYTLSLSQLALF